MNVCMCVYLDSQVIQVVSQYVSSSCDSSFSLVVLSGAQPWFNVLHGTIESHIVSDNAKLHYNTDRRVTTWRMAGHRSHLDTQEKVVGFDHSQQEAVKNLIQYLFVTLFILGLFKMFEWTILWDVEPKMLNKAIIWSGNSKKWVIIKSTVLTTQFNAMIQILGGLNTMLI